MSKGFFNNNPPNFIARLLIPAIIAIVIGTVFYVNMPNYFGVSLSLTFTVIKSILDGWALDFANRNLKKKEHLIHCNYALNKIKHVTTILTNSKYDDRVRVEAIGELEVILTDMWKCCFEEERTNFQEHKGLVGDYKTALQKSKFDPTIKPNITRFIGDLHKIETYLREKN
ncbi:MAG: hypothetical protein ACK43K_01100 [Chitinophagales bacterium]